MCPTIRPPLLCMRHPHGRMDGYIFCVCFSARFKGTEERAGMLVEYVCDRRIGTEQQLTGE